VKKQSSNMRKIFPCLLLIFVSVGVGSNLYAASRKIYFAQANGFNSQCSPDYQSITQPSGAPNSYMYGNTVRAKPQKTGNADQELPSFGVDTTVYASSVNLQETNCSSYINQNNQANPNNLFYDVWERIVPGAPVSLIVNPISKENAPPPNNGISEIPAPAALWLFGSATFGMYFLRKRKQVKV
jgi:hypothetical protein